MSARPSPVGLGAALGAFLAIGAANALYGPALPGLAARYGLAPGEVGLILFCHGAGAFAGVATSLVPGLERRLRPRQPIALGLMGAGAAALASLGPWPLPLAGALAVGAGFGMVTVGLNGLFSHAYGARSPMMVNLLNALYGVGAIAAPALYAATGGDARAAFGTLAALSLGLLLPALALDDRLKSGRSGPGADAPRPGAARTALALGVVAAATGLEASLVGWGPAILAARGVPELEAATLLSWFFAAFLASRMAAVPLSLRASPRTLATAALGAATAAIALAALIEAPGAAFVAAGVIGAAFPNLFAWLAGVLRGRAGGDGLLVCAALGGGALAPLVLGFLGGAMGTDTLLAPLVGLGLLGLVGAVALPRRARRDEVAADGWRSG